MSDKQHSGSMQGVLQMLRLVGHLRLAVVQLAALLLQDACLSAHEPLPGSPVAAAAGSAEECAATARGELLLTSLIALGKPPLRN